MDLHTHEGCEEMRSLGRIDIEHSARALVPLSTGREG